VHIHPNQFNPNSQLNGVQSAQRAQAKGEVTRTRKQLMDSASALAGEASAEAYIVEVESNEDSGRHRLEGWRWSRPKSDAVTPESKDEHHSVEDWA
jgi:hypothetical protein